MNQIAVFGYNSILKLKEFLPSEKTNIFLVTGKQSFNSIKNIILPIIGSSSITYFSNFSVNPKIEDVYRGVNLLKNGNCNLIIAIGGGSVLDMAKLIRWAIMIDEDIFNSEIVNEKKKIMLIAIPTTSGTGSEATHFAVVYKNNEKFSIANEEILPDIALIDPQFTYKSPISVLTTTAFDAFSQSIEAYWNVNSTNISDNYAFDSLKLMNEYLEKSIFLNDLRAKDKISEAAYLSGRAINITKTTGPHALSYAFSILYNYPHGHAVALSLPEFIRFNYALTEENVNDKRGIEYVKNKIDDISKLFGCKNVDQLINKIQILRKKFNLGIRVDDINIIDKTKIMSLLNIERANNNPRKIFNKDIENILNTIISD